jgi:hypothetical protein
MWPVLQIEPDGTLFSSGEETCQNELLPRFGESKQRHSGGDLKTKDQWVPQWWTVKALQVVAHT